MKLTELLDRLEGHEWNDCEFKTAANNAPRSAYETVCAFANTSGGWLVFGIKQAGESFEIKGVDNVDTVQNDFLSTLHADSKFNHDIGVQEHLLQIAGKDILAFEIAVTPRYNRPVYLNGDIRQTYIRRGGCDQRASINEIERILRDASQDRWDGQPFEYPLDEAFDSATIQWYRGQFQTVNPGLDHAGTDMDFLHHWGYLIRREDQLIPTRASILLFGSSPAIHSLLPRPTVDLQWIPAGQNDPQPEMRWLDRYVSEENLFNTWRELVGKYYKNEPRPFQGVDPHTLMRNDAPPGYRVFREAAINLLIHQDYADHTRKAVIKFYNDQIQFWNPGDVYGDNVNLLEPGEKESRNPRIVAAFRRLILCEQAGTGIRMMQSEWQNLGNPAPDILNDKSHKAFGYHLPIQGKPIQQTTERHQVGTKSALSRHQVKLLRNCSKYMAITELMEVFDRKDRTKFRTKYIKPLLDVGYIEMSNPENPTAANQKYIITDKGQLELERA